ncbi:MAG: ParA family protein [Brevinematales bacterium]|nr:ParA family protein [Brevinematales bacterium]
MGKTVVIANQKGGVGKTTTAVNLCGFLARNNKKTLLIDIDPQGNSCSGLGVDLKARTESSIYEVLIGKKNIQDVIIKTKYENFYLVPSNLDLAGAQAELLNFPRKEFILKDAVSIIKNQFDFIIIDTPPSLGLFTINGLVAADSVLIPMQAEFYAMEGLAQLLKAIKLIKSSPNKELTIEGVLITMYDTRTNLSKQVVEEVKSYFKEKLYETYIPRNVRLSEAPSHGVDIFDYDSKSPGAEAYEKFGKEFLEKNGGLK